jgi:outer membrane immunogenic protein
MGVIPIQPMNSARRDIQMKRVLLALLAGFALIVAASGTASAAPFTWTGCYVGANVGYGWAPTQWNDNGIEFVAHGANGAVGGGQIGCDYQSGPWVFGVQGMLNAAGMKGSSANLFLDPGGAVIDSTNVSAFATLTGRFGYAVEPSTLLYMKGGAAWVRSSFRECCEPTVVILDSLGPLNDGIADVTRTGWTIGAGLERMFAPNWSAFVEYNFIGLGTSAVTFSPINGAPGPFIYRIDQNVHAVLLGLNYRFGGPGSR